MMIDRLCPQCGVGLLQPTTAPYMRVINGTLIQAPQTPAWQCDMCRATYFDPAFVQQIELLAGTGAPPPNHYRPPIHESEPDAAAAGDPPHSQTKNR